ncbi:MAG: insulinase family protein [Burkholderiaceae bacterium]
MIATPARAAWLARCMGLFVLIGAASPAPGQTSAPPPLPAGLSEVRSVAGITEYRLDNGLQVLLMPVAGHPQTLVNITYRVGSRNEGSAEAGMAHLLEHVTFRGTAGTPDLGAALRAVPASFNGSTALDRTDYSANFVPGPERLREVLRLEAARMGEARLAQQDFDKEKPIVLNEMGLRGGVAQRQAMQALQAGAFRSHPYGRPVIGDAGDIEQLALPALQAFYRQYYRPDNATLMLAGAFDVATALQAVAEAFGPLRAPAVPLPALDPVEPQQQASRVVTFHAPQTVLAVGYRVPGMAHPDAAGLLVLSRMLQRGDDPFLRDGARPAQESGLNGGPVTRDPFLIGLVLRLPGWPSDTAAAREELQSSERRWLGHIQAPSRSPANALVVRRAIDEQALRLRSELQKPEPALRLLSDAVGAGDWRLPLKLAERLGQLKTDQVFSLAERYLRDENRVVARGVTDPAVQGQRVQEEELSALGRLFARPIEVETVRDASVAVGELKAGAESLSQGSAVVYDAESLDKLAKRYQLPSGLRLALLERDTAGERVTALLRLRWGDAAETTGLPGWRALTQRLLESGTQRWDAQQIARIKSQLQLDIQLRAGPQGLDVRLSTRQANLTPGLALLKDLLSEPRLAEPAFKEVQRVTLSNLAAAALDPAAPAREQDRRHRNAALALSPGDPDYQPSIEEQTALWTALTVEDARRFQRRYWSANEASLAIVGHLPADAMPVAEQLFGGWSKPEAPRYQRPQPAFRPEDGARFSASGPAQGSAIVSMRQGLALNRADKDYWPLLVGVQLLAGGNVMAGGRMGERLRTQEAISYTVSSELRVPEFGNRAQLRIWATGAPASAARVEALMQEEIARAAAEGFSAAELHKAQQHLRSEGRRRLAHDEPLAEALLRQLEREDGFVDEQRTQERALMQVDPAEVRGALQRLLLPGGWITTVTGAVP